MQQLDQVLGEVLATAHDYAEVRKLVAEAAVAAQRRHLRYGNLDVGHPVGGYPACDGGGVLLVVGRAEMDGGAGGQGNQTLEGEDVEGGIGQADDDVTWCENSSLQVILE